ncbi:thioesterase II family protein [Virgibacillus oceani]
MTSNKTIKKTIKVFRPNSEASFRLFCFSFAGGSASFFGDWQPILSQSGIETCAIQMPGREDRLSEKLLTNVDEIVSEVIEALEDFQDKPFAFFGHSMGTLISFEVARKLRLLKMRQPNILFMSSGKAPQIQPRRILHTLPNDSFLLKIKELGGTPDVIMENEDLSNIYLPILRADFKMIETYKYIDSNPLDTKIVAYGGRIDEEVKYEDIVAWEDHSLKPLKINMYEGSHFYLRDYKEKVIKNIIAHIRSDCQ